MLSEIIPKTIGASYWRSLAMPSTKIIRILIFITYPLVLLSELITKVFSPKNHQASVSREEVSAMVDVGTTEGIFRESESKIIKSCIRLAGVKAREVMTPSIVIESANVNLTIKEFYEQQTWNFSRIPVYDTSKDYIVGYVLKDMVLKELSEDKFDTKLSDLVRPILSFSEDDSVYQIWEKMLEKREHISIIPVSYTHLDVYKRQSWSRLLPILLTFIIVSIGAIFMLKRMEYGVLNILLGIMLILTSIYFTFFSKRIKVKLSLIHI